MAMVPTEFIGRYRVVGTLGQGAMGRVYLAEDPGLGMKVAVKLIKRDNMLENEVILARFRREAALGARIRHPNIVAIHDVGQDINHGPYMVMEYVDGRELADVLKEGFASIPEKLDWLLQTARALRCAHEAGIIHRDVKPANILVSRDGQAKLIDFGVARVMGSEFAAQAMSNRQGSQPPPEAELMSEKYATAWGMLSAVGAHDSEDPHLEILTSSGEQNTKAEPEHQDGNLDRENHSDHDLTQMGALIGTPSYTAPELLDGQGPSPQTDDFAFAVTAFQSLFGQLPFRGRATRETLGLIRAGAVEYPPNVNPALRRVFEKALALDPRARYPDLDAIVKDLYSACGVEQPPTGARTSRSHSRASLPAARPIHRVIPWLKAIGVSLAVLLLMGIGLDRWLAASSGLEEITVHTEPAGASVYVDGVYLGQAPLEHISLSQPGRHLRVVKKHYRSVDRSLAPEDGFVSLVLELAPYDLNVDTEPAGAEILLDGKSMGNSPALLKHVPGAGDHSLELRLNGFAAKTIKLDPLRSQGELIRLDPETPMDRQ